MSPLGDAVVVWDSSGAFLSTDASTGDLRWQSQPIAETQRVGSVVSLDIQGKPILLAVGDARLVAMDPATGENVGVSGYTHAPVTGALATGEQVVFGSSGRHLSWLRVIERRFPRRDQPKIEPGRVNRFSDAGGVARTEIVNYETRSIGLDGAAAAAPVAGPDGDLVVTSDRGEVCRVDPRSGKKKWRVQVPGTISAAAALLDGRVYMGADDQYLRAFDYLKGHGLWKWFAPGPLRRPILAIGDLVLTQVPDTGLVALAALPTDKAGSVKPDGEQLWTCPEVTGDPVTRNREGVVTWDAMTRTLALVDARNGKLRRSEQLPGVEMLRSTNPLDGNLYMLHADGRLQRCSVLEPMPAPAPLPESPDQVDEGSSEDDDLEEDA
jgi:outer membrane protein assembly factor BamB